jgi:hypothetical protein
MVLVPYGPDNLVLGSNSNSFPIYNDRALNMRLELRSEQEVREDKEIDKSECSISYGTNRLFCGKK